MLSSIRESYRQYAVQRTEYSRRPRRGASAIIMATALFVIFGSAGLAVDYALLVSDRNQLQRACDAAALAGAQELPSDTAKATSVAISTAAQNGVTINNGNIAFLDSNTKIRVVSNRLRSFFFMPILNVRSGQVRASAIAGVTASNTTTDIHIVPIGITEQTVEQYTRPTINTAPVSLDTARVQEEPFGVNDFVVYDLRQNGASPAQMQNQLINGVTPSIGESYRVLNASEGTIETFFMQALADRFLRASLPPWNDIWTGLLSTSAGIRYTEIVNGTSRVDNPRVVYLVTNPGSPQNNGITRQEVTGVVPVYLEGWTNNKLIVRFLPPSVAQGSSSGGAQQVSLLE